MTPPDIATIYNFNPLFDAGTSGQGQTIYLIEDSDLYSTGDWTTFRSTFGLSGYTGASLSTVHPAPPSGRTNCSDPGVNSDDIEAALDAEYASAAAPSAAIVMATCADTTTTFGGLIAIQNLINGSSPPAIISLSYLECEASNGASSNEAYNAIYQQGVAEGTSIFVVSGDEDAGVCDYGASYVTHGIGVNAFASTPYNLAVVGTDFGDTYAGTNSTYWNSGDTSTYGSAKSYIPEIPWNDTCASRLIATFEGYGATFGSSGYCDKGGSRVGLRSSRGTKYKRLAAFDSCQPSSQAALAAAATRRRSPSGAQTRAPTAVCTQLLPSRQFFNSQSNGSGNVVKLLLLGRARRRRRSCRRGIRRTARAQCRKPALFH